MTEVHVETRSRDRSVPGPVLFARYAFPPNSHGFCGPADHTGFFEYGADDRGLRSMSQQFAGAWPFLELIASATGLDDPLDHRVVGAYWVGSPRLDHVDIHYVGNSMEQRSVPPAAGTCVMASTLQRTQRTAPTC